MPATIPATNLLQPHHGVRRLICSCAAFQTAAGVATANDAIPFTMNTAVNEDFPKVRAIVRMDVGGVTRRTTGLGNWKESGTVYVCLQRWYPKFTTVLNDQSSSADISAYQQELDEQAATFAAWASTVVSEMETLLDSRQAIMGVNPVAVQSIRSDGEVYLQSAEATPKYDPNDSEYDSTKGNAWFIELSLELF